MTLAIEGRERQILDNNIMFDTHPTKKLRHYPHVRMCSRGQVISQASISLCLLHESESESVRNESKARENYSMP